jgi:indole-3-glycerol phosphate synthase
MPVLSEIKARSPKDGDLLRGRDPAELAAAMAGAGIAGLSVVTAREDFGGDVEIVRRVRRRVDVPLLRKDFTREVSDLEETVDVGADAILLTVCMLEDEALGVLHDEAQARGLETLVETHTEDELERVEALGLRPDVLGINNRDIQLLERDDGDVSRTERLAAHVPDGQLLLSESSIDGEEAVIRARDAGADAVLVGTWILKADDPGEAIRTLVSVGWPAR